MKHMIRYQFGSIKGFNKTFSDDFKIYLKLSERYKKLLDGIKPFTEIINYVSSIQKKLISEQLSLKELNQYLKAFLKVFRQKKIPS